MEEAQLASLNEEIYKIYENPMERLAEETYRNKECGTAYVSGIWGRPSG